MDPINIMPDNFIYQTKQPEDNKTKSQKIKTIGDLDRITRQTSNINVVSKPSFEDDCEPLTFNDYITNAKMAKEHKHKFTNPPSRSHSKKKLMNFFRPMSSKDTPKASDKIETKAEFKFIVSRKKHSKKNSQLDHDVPVLKRRNLNYKTPPPELVGQMHFRRN
jgi:hypothetical protein